jgi:hypothetical protein
MMRDLVAHLDHRDARFDHVLPDPPMGARGLLNSSKRSGLQGLIQRPTGFDASF